MLTGWLPWMLLLVQLADDMHLVAHHRRHDDLEICGGQPVVQIVLERHAQRHVGLVKPVDHLFQGAPAIQQAPARIKQGIVLGPQRLGEDVGPLGAARNAKFDGRCGALSAWTMRISPRVSPTTFLHPSQRTKERAPKRRPATHPDVLKASFSLEAFGQPQKHVLLAFTPLLHL